MNILQIDASSDLCSVALSQDGELIHQEINTEPYQHGRDINLLIQSLLDKCEQTLQDLHAVSLNKGPGSYTALRIGMATAKGLCYGLDIPLVTVSGLEILIDHGMIKHPEAEYYVPMIDARRMEVYTCQPKTDLADPIAFKSEVLAPNSYIDLAPKQVCFIGNGVAKWKKLGPKRDNWISEELEVNAGMMTRISFQNFGTDNISDLFTTTPIYIKKPNITQSKKQYFN